MTDPKDNEMTEEKAREIVKTGFSIARGGIFKAEGFLAGLEAERKRTEAYRKLAQLLMSQIGEDRKQPMTEEAEFEQVDEDAERILAEWKVKS